MTNNGPWKVLSSQEIYRNGWFSVRTDAYPATRGPRRPRAVGLSLRTAPGGQAGGHRLR
jgi:hypothetical protein